MHGVVEKPSFTIDRMMFYNPWLNIIASALGYLLFGTIVYACHKKGVLRKHMNDVLPMLTFVLLCDVLEMGRNLYFIVNLKEGDSLQTTFTACILHFWLTMLHFMLPYVQAVVGIHRFIVGFCGKPLPAYTIYIGLGLIFGSQAYFVLGDLLLGSTSSLYRVPHPVICTSTAPRAPLQYSFIVLFFAVSIAEAITLVLSTMHIVMGIVKKEQDYGVTVFILTSSPFVQFFILISIIDGLNNKYILSFVRYTTAFWDFLYVVFYHIEDFRLPVLCLFSIMIIGDIRDAVLSTASETIQKMFSRKKISATIGIHVETGENKRMLEEIQALP